MKLSLEELKILRMPEVNRLTGLGRSSIYKKMNDGLFPRSVHLGPRSVGWMTCDIQDWLQARRDGKSWSAKPIMNPNAKEGES